MRAIQKEGRVATRIGSAVKRLDKKTAIAEHAMNQYAALCYRISAKGRVRVLLITSRDTGRWVLPKGWPMKGLNGQSAAMREAYEEAGVQGEVSNHCLGFYSYSKVIAPDQAPTCIVSVFPVRVTQLLDKFPECHERSRKWFLPEKAAERVDEPELKEILLAFRPCSDAGKQSIGA